MDGPPAAGRGFGPSFPRTRKEDPIMCSLSHRPEPIAAFGLGAPVRMDAEPLDGGVLHLDGITAQALRQALRLDDPALRLWVFRGGVARILDAEGRVTPASGRLCLPGRELRFQGLARITGLR
jgi:hypothetical protein